MTSIKTSETTLNRDRLAVLLLIAVSLMYIVSRSVGLDQSLWEDELFTVNYYIKPGLSAIFDPEAYISNNHVFYSVVGTFLWSSVGNSEVLLRLGSIVPATAAVVVAAYWLWSRYGRVAAVSFAFAMTVSPLHFETFRNARGWGLAILSAAIVLIVSLEMQRSDRIKWSQVACFSLGSLIGIWTIYPLLLPLSVHGIVVLFTRKQRMRMIVGGVMTILGSLAFYWPLRSVLVDPGAARAQGSSPARDGFVTMENVITEPFSRLSSPLFDLAMPSEAALVVGIVLVICGIAWLLRAKHWVTLLHLLVPVIVVFVGLAARQSGIWDRYVSFLLPHIFVLSALGVSLVWSSFSASRAGQGVLALLGTVAALGIVLGFARLAIPIVSMPHENFKGAARVIEGATPVSRVYSYSLASSFNHYLEEVTVQQIGKGEFYDRSCTQDGPLIFVDYPRRIQRVDTSCLKERGVSVSIPHRRSEQLSVWFVP